MQRPYLLHLFLQVFVKVNLDDSGQKCGPTGPCRLMYQINNVRVDLDVMDPNNPLAICGTVDQVFDPVNSRAKGWSNQNEDICSSTQNSSLGKDSKLQSCPVGGLSRKWGVLSAFFDENLAAFNNIIGLSVIVYNISSKGVPVVKGCAPIRFLENCNLEGASPVLHSPWAFFLFPGLLPFHLP